MKAQRGTADGWRDPQATKGPYYGKETLSGLAVPIVSETNGPPPRVDRAGGPSAFQSRELGFGALRSGGGGARETVSRGRYLPCVDPLYTPTHPCDLSFDYTIEHKI